MNASRGLRVNLMDEQIVKVRKLNCFNMKVIWWLETE